MYKIQKCCLVDIDKSTEWIVLVIYIRKEGSLRDSGDTVQ